MSGSAIRISTVTAGWQPFRNVQVLSVASLEPSPDWDGTAASGFDGNFGETPSDPTRITAKPVCRLLEVPGQAFTDELTVGVIAMANNGNTLLDNYGLEKVIVHYEGAQQDILSPSFRTFSDANGNTVTYLGWWVTLSHNGTNGQAQIYFEAVPGDASMQSRVIGPYSFLPRSRLYDLELEVAPGTGVIAGERYQSLKSAVAYIKSSGAQHPRITITETNEYSVNYWVSPTTIEGWVTFEAADGVTATIRQTGAYSQADTTKMLANIATRFRGGNVVLDFVDTIELDRGGQHEYWFDGCTITNSAGAYSLWRKQPRAFLGWLVDGSPWHTESVISNVLNPLDKANLARGVVARDTREDFANGALCLVGCESHVHNNDDYRSYLPAMTITYTGGAASATIESTGSKLFTLKEAGVSIGTFQLANSAAAYTAGTNFSVSNLVDWVNSHPNWYASLLDDTRAGVFLSLDGDKATAIEMQECKGAEVTLYTHFDLHGDFYQRPNGSNAENVVFYGNTATGAQFQALFAGSGGSMKDIAFINNAWHLTDASHYYTGAQSSPVSGQFSHVIVAHNSWVGQRIILNDETYGTPGGYNLIANNVAREALWVGAPPQSGLVVSDNHVSDGASVPAPPATGTTVGGDYTSLFQEPADGNFMPAGSLLVSLAAPVVQFDLHGTARAAAAAKGAVA